VSLITPSRSSFIGGLGLLFAAPAIVRASSLMPVKVMRAPRLVDTIDIYESNWGETPIPLNLEDLIYNITPHQTPFLTLAHNTGRTVAQWQLDALAPRRDVRFKLFAK
jgi:hypothetical protein